MERGVEARHLGHTGKPAIEGLRQQNFFRQMLWVERAEEA
jgi:hypothetical protein